MKEKLSKAMVVLGCLCLALALYQLNQLITLSGNMNIALQDLQSSTAGLDESNAEHQLILRQAEATEQQLEYAVGLQQGIVMIDLGAGAAILAIGIWLGRGKTPGDG